MCLFKQEHHWRLMDKAKRKIFLKYEIFKILSKSLIRDASISVVYKYYIYLKLIKLIKYANIGLRKNRCILSGRTYGILSYFKLSRFFLKLNILRMNTFGLRRLSW